MGLFDRLAKLEREGGVGVLATVIKSHGSVPRREGSKMLINKEIMATTVSNSTSVKPDFGRGALWGDCIV